LCEDGWVAELLWGVGDHWVVGGTGVGGVEDVLCVEEDGEIVLVACNVLFGGFLRGDSSGL